MEYVRHSAKYSVVIFLFAALLSLALVPTISSAQEDPLSATIRAAITTDADTQNLSQDEIDAMVEALAKEAQLEGVTAGDIAWRPEEQVFTSSVVEEEESCGRLPAVLCMLNEALGFSGGNLIIPILLFASSMALIFVIAALIHAHRPHALQTITPPLRGNVPPAQIPPTPSSVNVPPGPYMPRGPSI